MNYSDEEKNVGPLEDFSTVIKEQLLEGVILVLVLQFLAFNLSFFGLVDLLCQLQQTNQSLFQCLLSVGRGLLESTQADEVELMSLNYLRINLRRRFLGQSY